MTTNRGIMKFRPTRNQWIMLARSTAFFAAVLYIQYACWLTSPSELGRFPLNVMSGATSLHELLFSPECFIHVWRSLRRSWGHGVQEAPSQAEVAVGNPRRCGIRVRRRCAAALAHHERTLELDELRLAGRHVSSQTRQPWVTSFEARPVAPSHRSCQRRRRYAYNASHTHRPYSTPEHLPVESFVKATDEFFASTQANQ